MTALAARRFYRTAAVAADGAGVMLDERRLKTPRGKPFRAPTRALAEAVAAEWDAQGEHVVPAAMPLSQLAFAAVDHTPARRAELIDFVAKFGETDLVCHRADAPAQLVARQAALWDPLVLWAREALGLTLPVVTGIVAASVSASDLSRLRAMAQVDDFRLTLLAQAAGLTGSAVIAFALLEGRLDAASAFEAAALDDLWSLDQWGEDAEARARLNRLRADIDAVARFSAALRA